MPATGRSSSFVLATLSIALLVLPACGGDDPTDVQSYIDGAGRSCTVDANDIVQAATCDADPAPIAGCSPSQEASFVVSDDVDFETHVWTLRSCVACLDRPAHMTYVTFGSCTNITCETDADCIYDRYTCMAGICQDMTE